jgi:nicotinate-nucleotide pyrophosphorylase
MNAPETKPGVTKVTVVIGYQEFERRRLIRSISCARRSTTADAVLLDNMDPATLTEAVAMVAGQAVTEATGRITPATAPQIAATGVDLISIGWLTHSVGVLDIGLDFKT